MHFRSRPSLWTFLAVGAAAVSATGAPSEPRAAVVTAVVYETVTTCPSESATAVPTTAPSSSEEQTTTYTITTTATKTHTVTGPSAPACTDYWLGKIEHRGLAPYAAADGYQVFRNVRDYGARGDGVTDDTDAINRAIRDGGRCGPGTCASSTTTPALVYFPPGTYLVSAPIIDYYYTMLVGNPGCLPVLKASPAFRDRWLVDGDPYQPSGSLAWGSTNVFWRQVRNLELDLTAAPPDLLVAALHWPVGQATSLENLVVRLSTAPGTQHQGLFIEEGSGGYAGDLVFYGGAQALAVGNQQFTMRNLTIRDAVTAVQQAWDWGWTYQGLHVANCSVALDITAADPQSHQSSVGGVVLLDSDVRDTRVAIAFGNANATGPAHANNIVVENLRLSHVETAIQGPGGSTVLAGSSGTTTIQAWGRGNRYDARGADAPTFFQGFLTPNARPPSLVSGADYYERSKPSYADEPASQFLSARAAGARGDGATDDTAALNALLARGAAEGKIVFLDAGVYVVRGTVRIPAGTRVVGEAFPVILSEGDFFADASAPQPVVQVGQRGGEESSAAVEWSDVIVSTRGAQPGAVLIEWNLAVAADAPPSGMWDVHTRVGGFQGSDLQVAQCRKTPDTTVTSANLDTNCVAAFMSMHITEGATGLYMQNVWLWVADHDVEDPALTQITVYAGRGLLVESTRGRLWLYGTAVEHHQLYEYQLVGAADVVLGQMQTETAYYQPNPDARLPFAPLAAYHDPVFAAGDSGWGLRVVDSTGVLVYGAGLYSFFDNYSTNCSAAGGGETCQRRIFSVEGGSELSVYNLNTVGTTKLITVDGRDLASYADNADGFVQSVALFRA